MTVNCFKMGESLWYTISNFASNDLILIQKEMFEATHLGVRKPLVQAKTMNIPINFFQLDLMSYTYKQLQTDNHWIETLYPFGGGEDQPKF